MTKFLKDHYKVNMQHLKKFMRDLNLPVYSQICRDVRNKTLKLVESRGSYLDPLSPHPRLTNENLRHETDGIERGTLPSLDFGSYLPSQQFDPEFFSLATSKP